VLAQVPLPLFGHDADLCMADVLLDAVKFVHAAH